MIADRAHLVPIQRQIWVNLLTLVNTGRLSLVMSKWEKDSAIFPTKWRAKGCNKMGVVRTNQFLLKRFGVATF